MRKNRGFKCVTLKTYPNNSWTAVAGPPWLENVIPGSMIITIPRKDWRRPGRVVDPHWFNADPDPAFSPIADPNPDPVTNPGFDDQKFYIFWSKIAIYLSLCLHKGRKRYRRSLQPSKENIQHSKTLFTFFYICGSFELLDPDADPQSREQGREKIVSIDLLYGNRL